jgi:tRNA (uracil-5-)-methyltransferase
MSKLVTSISDTDSVVAILDPPRSGVHSSVIQSIRGCSKIDRLIYISCNAESAQKNFVDLTRPTSKRYEGSPFIPVRGVGVDLFPMTSHAELIMEWARLPNQL